jgi:hypothetical protein
MGFRPRKVQTAEGEPSVWPVVSALALLGGVDGLLSWRAAGRTPRARRSPSGA